MYWLFIDTSKRGRMRLALLPERGHMKSASRKVMPGAAVSALARFIAPTAAANLDGIGVVAGPGSFSAVRSGVLIANLLSRVFGLPLYGLSKNEAADLSQVRERLRSGSVKSSPYVAPVYDAEPNITC